MRRTLRNLSAVLVPLLAAAASVCAADTVLVDGSSPVQWLANGSDPGLGDGWTQVGFDDSAWNAGAYGIGFDTGGAAAGLLATTVPAGSFSVYTRTTFDLSGDGALGNLYLGIDYDDGWALWINGVEVARSSEMPAGTLDWNSAASSHESSNGAVPVYTWVDLTATGLPQLVNGTNVVALGVWNTDAGSSDLVLAPLLVADKTPQLVRGPYLQLATDDGVVVRWRTDVATDSRVDCGATPGALSPCASDLAAVTDHELALTGLSPDTAYTYAVADATTTFAGDDADHVFRTAPLPGTQRPTRVWIVGDSGTADANARAVRDAYAGFATGTPTDLWLMLGDNAYPNGTDAEYQAALFDTFPELLRSAALWPTFGNHDAASSNASNLSGPYFDMFTLPTSAEAGGVASGTEAYYSFDYANVHFVVLDSQTSDRSPGSAMLTWLEADLAATAQDWIVASWHHPPYSKGSHDSDAELRLVEMRENVLPILEDYGVDLVFTGHSHSYERSYLLDGHYGDSSTFHDGYKVDLGDGDEAGDGAYQKPALGPDPHRGTVYTVAGNGGQLSGGSLDHAAILVALNELGSVILDVNGGRADVTFLNSAGTVRDRFTMTKGPVGLPPVAELGAWPLAGRAPLSVQLIDRSSNVPDSWGWDFEDDGFVDSNAQAPQHTYGAPGLYSVALAVSNANGADQTVAVDLICVTAGIPEPVQALHFDDETTLRWDPAGGAGARYDVARGDLGTLRAGDLAGSQQSCLLSDTAVTELQDAAAPAPGDTFYYLVRARNCAGESGSFDSLGGGQTTSRDLAMQGAAAVCGCSAAEDPDGDGLCANLDNCPQLATPDLTDTDLDTIGDACDACPLDALNDADADGFCAEVDNCPATTNPLQTDIDLDGIGDACDSCTDTDGDGAGDPGFPNNTCTLDNCPATVNPGQENTDGDAFGNICDGCPNDPLNDIDGDGICGDVDNCPMTPNADQKDADGDGIGDVCDPCTDLDGDGAGDPGFAANTCPLDNCPATPNPGQENDDGDAFGNICDVCPNDPLNDFDGDGVCGDVDNCPFTANASQTDADMDGMGDACDPCPNDMLNDVDGDFICGDVDNCPATPNFEQLDFDGDGMGDACDTDDDDDGTPDAGDCAPFMPSLSLPAAPVGDSLRLDENAGTAELSWLRADQGHVSNVYRSVRGAGLPYGGDFACLAAETPTRAWSDGTATSAGTVLYYLVSARNGCGESAPGFDSDGVPIPVNPTCPALGLDFDADGLDDWIDNCPLAPNATQADADHDFVGDACDNCPATPNPDQADSDGDMIGDACE